MQDPNPEPTIFTKIINGDIPCYKIYEDELTYAFLDIRPLELGHTLIVSKKQIDYYMDLPEEDYLAVFKTARILSPAIQTATGAKRIATMVVGDEVPHFHYHLVPFIDTNPVRKDSMEKSKEDMKNIQQLILKNL